MSHVEAIYQHGVFRPLGQVKLPENQRVRLHVEAVSPSNSQAWLDDARKLQRQFTDNGRTLPNSEDDIASDRTR
jgi:predicted DNA-binding antitoxin AbrB/MazE fold protein